MKEQVGGPWLAPDMAAAAKAGAKKKKTGGGEDGGAEAATGGLLSLATMLTMSSAGADVEGPDWLPGGADDRHAALHAAVVWGCTAVESSVTLGA